MTLHAFKTEKMKDKTLTKAGENKKNLKFDKIMPKLAKKIANPNSVKNENIAKLLPICCSTRSTVSIRKALNPLPKANWKSTFDFFTFFTSVYILHFLHFHILMECHV